MLPDCRFVGGLQDYRLLGNGLVGWLAGWPVKLVRGCGQAVIVEGFQTKNLMKGIAQ